MPESLKVAATYSPTTQCSTIGDAVCGRLCRLSPAPLLSPRGYAAPLCPPRASDALREWFGATRSWDIKDMVSLKKVSLFFRATIGRTRL